MLAIELILNALHLQGDEKRKNNLASDVHCLRFQFKNKETHLADEAGGFISSSMNQRIMVN